MKDLGDKIIINLGDKEALAQYFGRKEPGEQCQFVITATLDEITSDQAVLSMEKVKVEHPEKELEEVAEDANKEAEAVAGDETQPVLEWAKSNMASMSPVESSQGQGY